MYIVINCLGMPFNGNTIMQGKSLGGSETACYYMAKELVKLGHIVTVFTTSQERGKFEGVNYEWCGEITQQTPLGHICHTVIKTPIDVCICQRSPMAFIDNPNSKLNIWWLHDLALYRFSPYVQRQLPFIDTILTVSNFHSKQVSKVYDIDESFIFSTQNGIDYSMIPNWKDNIKREKKSLMFAARPERGLQELVMPGGIMERLPEFKLYVCGYDNTTKQMESFYRQLWSRCEQLPNVENLGSLSKADLYRKMCETEVYVYPTMFEDTSCISAMEAQACGLPWISCDRGALKETLKNGGFKFSPQKDNKKVDIDNFVKTIKNVFSNNLIDGLREKTGNIYNPWSRIAGEWDALFKKLIKYKSKRSLPNLIKHLENNSDIVALKKLGVTEESFPNLKYYNFAFVNGGVGAKNHYKAYYEYEKNRGVVYGAEDLTNNKRFEVTYNLIKEQKCNTLLDYGCAHGHYTINLAKRMPNVKLTGVDLAESNIEIAKQWAKNDKVDDRVNFELVQEEQNCTYENLPNWQKQQYDIILAEEVLEHVLNPRELIIKLKSLLTPTGQLIISVPYGAWEAIGYEQHKGWRAHLHHFERTDLEELFKNQDGYKLYAIPHNNKLGHYIVTIKKGNMQIGHIDYDKKLEMQAPIESISLCIIAKNEENTLAIQCKKMRQYIDEIIIGVDKTSTDKTLEIAKQYGDMVIEINSPVGVNGIGFDMARNYTINHATKDWILWLDCDESLENPELLKKYTRNNCINGYFIPQHHYSVEPPTIIKTDYPVRLFRNNKGIKFFGFIHEHPEIEINKGVGKAIMLDGIHIMHTGYSTENIRRKRFGRNFPMMQKDIKINPKRHLSQFLYLRDLNNLMAYNVERYGEIKYNENIHHAHQIIQYWNQLLNAKKIRMTLDAIPYYSNAVSFLGKGIKFKYNMKVAPINGELRDTRPIEGIFQDKKTIEKLLLALTEENLKDFENKYF